MPTYVYKFVDTGETIEVQQAFTDETLTEAPHPRSGEMMAVKKVFQPVGVTFKGSGFFKTDNRSSRSSGGSNGSGGSGSSASSDSSGSSGSSGSSDSSGSSGSSSSTPSSAGTSAD